MRDALSVKVMGLVVATASERPSFAGHRQDFRSSKKSTLEPFSATLRIRISSAERRQHKGGRMLRAAMGGERSISSQARKLADFVRSVKLSSRYTLMMSTRHRSQTRCSTGSSGSPPMSTMPDCASSVRFSLSIGWIVNRANVPAEASCEALVRNDGFRKTVESTICSREMLLVSHLYPGALQA